MFDRSVREVMQKRRVLKAPPQTFVAKAAKLMEKRNVGAVLVVETDRLVGILTERDVTFRVVAQGLDARTTRLSEVMTRDPRTIDADESLGHALLVMHEHGFRHLPVIEAGRIIGIISSRSLMDPEMEDFVTEARRREHFQSARLVKGAKTAR